ncbi:LysR family transcriptional regulator [Aromatoleum sp.]|uniref:LysR family transcriptional regulator n=1 Tax=Aromatoleum sp. TaxID=2307007 RepID=UPI002FC9BED9
MKRTFPSSFDVPAPAVEEAPPQTYGGVLAAPLKRMPPLTALSYFEVAARLGSFAAAAKALHVSPAAISHQIKALEDHLGVELFERHHRKVIPSRAAEAALPRLQEGFAALADAVDRMRAHGEGRWVVTVCAEPLLATKWLVPRLHRYYARCPDAEVRLQASLSSVDAEPGGPVTAAAFQRSGIDLSVRLGYGRYAGLDAAALLELVRVPMCAPALVERLPTPDALLTLPLLVDATLLRGAERSGWNEWLRAAGVTPSGPLREQRFGNGLLALEAAITGQGVLLASPALTRAELEAGKLVVAFDLPLRSRLAYHVVCPPASLERPVVAAFRDWLLDEVGQADADGYAARSRAAVEASPQ